MQNYEQLMHLLQRRRSIRRFTDQPVPENMIARIIEAACCAPSAGNRQPFRFIVVTNRHTIHAMTEAVEDAIKHISLHLADDRLAAALSYMQNFLFFRDAPVILAPIYRHGVDLLVNKTAAKGPGAASINRPTLDAISSVAAALMNALLAAHLLGLGACWMTGPLYAEENLKTILQVPQGWGLAALIPLGFPDEDPPPPRRRPLTAMVRNIR